MRVLAPIIRAALALSKFTDIATLGVVLLCAVSMAAVIALQVFFRYVLNHSLFWSEELGRMLLVWLTFFGAAAAYARGAHVGVDFLVHRLRPGWRKASRFVVLAASMACFAVMAVYGFRFMEFIRFQTTASLGVSRAWPFAAVPASGCVMCLHCLVFFLVEIQGAHDEDGAPGAGAGDQAPETLGAPEASDTTGAKRAR